MRSAQLPLVACMLTVGAGVNGKDNPLLANPCPPPCNQAQLDALKAMQTMQTQSQAELQKQVEAWQKDAVKDFGQPGSKQPRLLVAKVKKRRVLVLGHVNLRLKKGQRKTFSIKLSKLAKRLFAHPRKLGIALPVKVQTRMTVIKPPKHKGGKKRRKSVTKLITMHVALP